MVYIATEGLARLPRSVDSCLIPCAPGVADSTSGLRHGTGITFGPDGHLYVSSSGNNQILRFDGETGKLLGVFVRDTILFRPFSLAFGPDGNLYVSSGKTSNVLRYDGRTGQYLGVAAGSEHVRSPIGLAFGPDKRLYVANAGGKNVLRFDGTTGALLGIAGRDSLTFVSDVAFGPDAMLYASDASLRRVVRFDPSTGNFLGVVATLPEGSVPVGIAFDRQGRLWIGDFAKSQLFRLDVGASVPALVASEGMGRPENLVVRPRR